MSKAHALGPALSLTLIFGIGVSLAVTPKLRQHRKLAEEIASLEAELAQPIDEPGMIDQLNGELDQLRELGATRMTPIPALSDMAGLVRDVSSKLESLGLDRNELTTGQAQQLDEASSVPVSLHIKGRFPQVFEALAYIESLPRLVRITRLTISNPTAAREPGVHEVIEADVLLDVFFAPRDRGPGGGSPT